MFIWQLERLYIAIHSFLYVNDLKGILIMFKTVVVLLSCAVCSNVAYAMDPPPSSKTVATKRKDIENQKQTARNELQNAYAQAAALRNQSRVETRQLHQQFQDLKKESDEKWRAHTNFCQAAQTTQAQLNQDANDLLNAISSGNFTPEQLEVMIANKQYK